MLNQADVEEEIWALEEEGARYIRDGDDGDTEKSITFYHDQFLGWPEVESLLVDKTGILQLIIKDIASDGTTYSFEIERLGFRLFENTATTHLCSISASGAWGSPTSS